VRAQAITDATSVWIDSVSVAYRRPRAVAGSVREAVGNAFTRRGTNEFWALRDVSARIRRGEVLGVIGANGSGKSTLLKALAQVVPPTTGRVVVRGRVAPLIELGAGFHPELSALENVVLHGALLGQDPRVLRATAREVTEFAGVEDFATAPIRTFSSGMLARLAFAVSTTCDPDVLLIDEVLAVGDQAFQDRSGERIRHLLTRGAAVALVSHDLDAILRLSQRVLWLDHGDPMAYGHPASVVSAYLSHGAQAEGAA
jgi:ABC-type polysaccharide/polyol phosphate transport system ATPase subunit